MHRLRNSSSATEPGGPDGVAAEVLLHAPGAAGHREEDQAEEAGEKHLAAADLRIGHLAGLARQEPERKGVVRAVLDAVQANEALALAQVLMRVGRPFAALQAKVAVGAAHRVAIDPPEREPAEEPQECTQRADRAAEESRNPPVGKQEADEDAGRRSRPASTRGARCRRSRSPRERWAARSSSSTGRSARWGRAGRSAESCGWSCALRPTGPARSGRGKVAGPATPGLRASATERDFQPP